MEMVINNYPTKQTKNTDRIFYLLNFESSRIFRGQRVFIFKRHGPF
jgi:hypothetical protein